MSIRIQNDAVSGGVSPEVNRTGDAGHIGAGSSRGRVGSGTSASGDHVEISNAAETFSSGLSAGNVERGARVKELSALYASGRYSVDSIHVSRALVSNSIAGPAAGGR